MADRRRFRGSLIGQLKTWLCKGSPTRAAYEACRVVLRIRESRTRGSFFYLGYGNLQTNNFTVLPLEEVEIPCLPVGRLAFRRGGDPRELDVIGK